MRNRFLKYCILILIPMLWACAGERYREDRKNRLTRRAKIASDYLANQAVEITQENIDKKEYTNKKSRKNLLKKQKELNEVNDNTSKVKPQKKHSGNFIFY